MREFGAGREERPLNQVIAAPSVLGGTPWWVLREMRLREAVRRIGDKSTITVLQPFAVVDNDIPGVDLRFANHTFFDDENAEADIYLSQGYGQDIAPLWNVVKTGRAGVAGCWFWDNHHLLTDTMHAAMLADVNFCAHGFASHYVANELGQYGGLVPLCPIFWTNSMATSVLKEMEGGPRSNRLYGGYNSYLQWPERNSFLRACMEVIPENAIEIYPYGTLPQDHRYYALSREAKLREWCSHKTALCVSFGVNTTMRMFESLLGGQIPIVVGDIHDLDAIIPPADQMALPLIRVVEPDPRAVRQAYEHAIECFDADGEIGARRRSEYVLQRHMPRNRLLQMIDRIRNLEFPSESWQAAEQEARAMTPGEREDVNRMSLHISGETSQSYEETLDAFYSNPVKQLKDGMTRSITFDCSLLRDQGRTIYDLMRAIRPANSLEIGLAWGGSAIHILSALRDNGAGHHTALDPMQASWSDIGVSEPERLGLGSYLTCLYERSDVGLPRMIAGGRRFQFIFIDGDHRFDGVFVDFHFCQQLLDVGGVLMFDDANALSVGRTLSFIDTNMPNLTRLDVPTFGRLATYRKTDEDRRELGHEFPF